MTTPTDTPAAPAAPAAWTAWRDRALQLADEMRMCVWAAGRDAARAALEAHLDAAPGRLRAMLESSPQYVPLATLVEQFNADGTPDEISGRQPPSPLYRHPKSI